MVMARSWTNCPAGSAATRSAQTTTPIAGRCEIVFSSEHCGAPNRTILEFSSQNSCQPCHRQRSLLEDLRHSSDKPPTEPNACQREGLFCFRHRWCYNIAMQRTLEWIKNQNFQGFGCSECNWKFKPVGALVGDSLDEMKRNYLAQCKREFAAHACVNRRSSIGRIAQAKRTELLALIFALPVVAAIRAMIFDLLEFSQAFPDAL